MKRYAVSENGWIDQELFHFWLTEHFLQHAINSGPILLLLDGHSLHFKPDTIHFAKEQNVVVFCLPPHTTHECQPLDCSLFGPLKVHWRHVCHEFHQKNPYGTITKLNFTGLFKQAWLKAISGENIVNGFKKSGVFPFDPTRVSALMEVIMVMIPDTMVEVLTMILLTVTTMMVILVEGAILPITMNPRMMNLLLSIVLGHTYLILCCAGPTDSDFQFQGLKMIIRLNT